MADPFKKVSPGQRLKIPAEAYNAFVDAARAVKASRQGIDSQTDGTRPLGGIIRIRNNTAAARKRFDVLTLSSPMFPPAAEAGQATDGFKNDVVFIGAMPTTAAAGTFAILLEPLDKQAIGRAMVAGMCPCRLSIPAGTPEPVRFADVKDNSADALEAATAGAAQVLWYGSDAGGGLKWAVVRVGNPPPKTRELFMVKLEEDGTGTDGTKTTAATWKYKVLNYDTNQQMGTPLVPEAPRPNGKMTKATLGMAYWDFSGVLHLALAFEAPTTGSCPDA